MRALVFAPLQQGRRHWRLRQEQQRCPGTFFGRLPYTARAATSTVNSYALRMRSTGSLGGACARSGTVIGPCMHAVAQHALDAGRSALC